MKTPTVRRHLRVGAVHLQPFFQSFKLSGKAITRLDARSVLQSFAPRA